MPLHLLTLCRPKSKGRKKKEMLCYAIPVYMTLSRLSLDSNNLMNLPIPDLFSDNNTLTIGTLLNI
jgi:hypothetical protein